MLECRVQLANATTLALVLYDLSGRRIAAQSLGEVAAGSHAVSVPLDGLAHGVHSAVVAGGGVRAAVKFVNLR